ncbi:37S ribosomal protein S9 [Rostrohypoxylon terebratum]|nr:37S ribosomal protein S9 [Rostrohypoxylon terebratum]
MSSLRYGFRCLRDLRPVVTRQSHSIRVAASSKSRRTYATTTEDRINGTDQLERLMLGATETDDLSKLNSDTMQIAYRRPVPVSPSYFTRQAKFIDSFVLIQDLAQKYGRLPTAPPNQTEPIAWKTKEQYRLSIGETIKARDFAICLRLAKKLSQIHPDLMPEEVIEGIKPFKRDINSFLNKAKQIPVDKFGRSHGVGRRKSSVARVWLVEGTGEVLINGKTISDAFGRIHDRESALWGLKTMERMDKYNVWALVEGGGTTGQAEALAMAIAKALVIQEPALKTSLRKGKSGC